jgi:eukaryotic-like serine/threonine-protein kinase
VDIGTVLHCPGRRSFAKTIILIPDIRHQNQPIIVFSFITKRSFWLNLIIAIALALAILFAFFQLLDWITKHGEYVKVPDVKGKKIEEAKKILQAQGFEVAVQDSVYYDSLPKLSIVKQSPDQNEMVKVNRTVYLTVNRASAPLVVMPNFVGQTFRSVQMQLNTLGLKLGDTLFRPDFAVGSILEQQYLGSGIKPGTKIPMGSKITLIIGGGIQNRDMAVPSLVGLTFSEAKMQLEENGLLLGAVVTEGNIKDSANAFVVKQNPPRRDEEGRPNRIRGGQLMDLWISADKSVVDSIQK